jgi:predicted signal transduction protein with EAL and GGDEF domain
MQDDVAHPNSVDGHFVSVTISVGFALSARLDAPTADKLLAGAASAMTEARRNGPSAIRFYTKEMDHLIAAPNELAQSIQRALDEGEITAYYQPQVTARTGDITGFEALARWEHPEHGTLPPQRLSFDHSHSRTVRTAK